SASGVMLTPTAAIGPPPTVMATYWRRLIENVTAPPTTCEGRRVSHKTTPLSASSARRYRSMEPLKRSPPPVARTGEEFETRVPQLHTVLPVSAEIASMRPTLSLPVGNLPTLVVL